MYKVYIFDLLEMTQTLFNSCQYYSVHAKIPEVPKSDDEFDLDEDEEFMASYRAKRMMEMKEKATPTFGRIIELTDKDYCDTIDNAHSATDVVVYIYEDHLVACRRFVAYSISFKSIRYFCSTILNLTKNENRPSMVLSQNETHDCKPLFTIVSFIL